MACLRESPAKGRWGAVQCDEEGCQFRCDEITCSGELVGTSPTSHCLLQLRLRAGDMGAAEAAKRNADGEITVNQWRKSQGLPEPLHLDRDRYPFAKHFGIEAVGDLGPYPHSCSCHVNGLDCGICNDLGCTYNKSKRVFFTEEELVQFITGHLNISLSTSQRYWVGEYFKENPGITHHDTSDTRGL